MNLAPKQQTPLKVDYTDPSAAIQLAEWISGYTKWLPANRRIVVVCLGTDRSTGDSLGPITGTVLSKFKSPSFDLFGTLEEPVHAVNLGDTLDLIRSRYRQPFIVGVDACLGKAASVGTIHVGEGPIRPGAGVNKELPPVGDIHISGVVNIGGFMEYFVLQNTRLHLVMGMAELIAQGFYRAVNRE
ncbi:spore protease YyaC [Cohnella sp. CFH 77786]|uniref:spore protease YyaC n=1 Tax=Cohnella sp. CFH 77786 TaxID=2662265 RepID=UPI001C608DCF|nr:spore protease YyaC [Cohnella sp. CFH 77786]MBW5448569.1 spore protease YyaC [Cohnella sp. CFH 77786]